MLAFDTVAVPTSVAAGAATSVGNMGHKCVTLESAGTATYQLQISLDSSSTPASTSWINEGTALTTSGDLEVTKPCAWLRWNCTAYTSGTPVSHVAGERA